MKRSRRLLPICLLLMTLISISSVCAVAAEPASTRNESQGWSARLGIDPSSMISPGSLTILGVATVASWWAWEESDERQGITKDALDSSFLDPTFDFGNTYGSGWISGVGSATVLAMGKITGHQRTWDLGTDLCRSFLYANAISATVKVAVDRDRPTGDPLSFPSGHTTSAFSLVSPIWHHLGWQAGTLATMLATTTALGRMEENRHYLSDVIAGAAVGLIVGRAVIRQRKNSEALEHMMLSPRGIGLTWNF